MQPTRRPITSRMIKVMTEGGVMIMKQICRKGRYACDLLDLDTKYGGIPCLETSPLRKVGPQWSFPLLW